MGEKLSQLMDRLRNAGGYTQDYAGTAAAEAADLLGLLTTHPDAVVPDGLSRGKKVVWFPVWVRECVHEGIPAAEMIAAAASDAVREALCARIEGEKEEGRRRIALALDAYQAATGAVGWAEVEDLLDDGQKWHAVAFAKSLAREGGTVPQEIVRRLGELVASLSAAPAMHRRIADGVEGERGLHIN